MLLLAALPAGAETGRSAEAQTRYLELLEYEYANRTFAYVSTRKISEMREGTAMGEFYGAYHELEIYSRTVYEGMADSLECDCSSGWFARMRGHVVGFLGGVVDPGPEALADLVVPYLPKLEELRDLSDPSQRAFFDYVVDQERVQLQAAEAASSDGWEAGADVFRAFLAERRATH